MPETKLPVSKSAKDCLSPLIQGAINTSVLSHRWGTENKAEKAQQATELMEFADYVLTECNKLIKAFDE